MKVLVTGASGMLGAAVADALAARGDQVTVLQRRPSGLGHHREVLADIADAVAVGDAVAGHDAVVHLAAKVDVTGPWAGYARTNITGTRVVVDAAAAAGVRRIVYLSFVGAAPDAVFTLVRDHWGTEQRIRASGLEWTFARMSLYLDFVPQLVTPEGEIRGPAGDGRLAAVTRADVADSVVVLLGQDGPSGGVHELTGREAPTLAELAARLGVLAGRPVTYVEETVEEAFASRAHFGAEDFELEAWVSTYTAIASGALAEVTGTVRALTGREPQRLEDYVAEHPEALDHLEVTG